MWINRNNMIVGTGGDGREPGERAETKKKGGEEAEKGCRKLGKSPARNIIYGERLELEDENSCERRI